MRANIDGQIYDTEFATSLAAHSTISSHEELFQNAQGEFFLWVHQISVEGQKVDLKEVSPDVRLLEPSDSPLRCFQKIIPLTRSEALAWCIETQIPQSLRAHLCQCL